MPSSDDFAIQIRAPETARTALQSDCWTLLKCGFRFLTDTTTAAVAGGVTSGPVGVVAGGTAGAIQSRYALGDALKELKNLAAPERGWVLCHRSMCHAIGQLYEDLHHQFPEVAEQSHASRIEENLRPALRDSNVAIDREFFANPAPDFANRMAERWRLLLNELDLSSQDAKSISARLPAYFSRALLREFRSNSRVYDLLSPDTPFDNVVERRFQWLEYADTLHRKQFEPLFDEHFCLNDVFVPLRCEWHERDGVISTQTPETDANESVVRQVHLLHEYLSHWIQELTAAYAPENALRILSGGPGSGKSVSARMFATKVARAVPDWHAIYVPLHQFEFHEQLETALDKFCEWHEPPLPQKLLSRDASENLLLVFDGLDELAKQGDVGAEASQSFAQHVIDWLDKHGDKRQICVLLCGRPVAAGRASSVRGVKNDHTLMLLPYFFPLSEGEKVEYHDPHKLLEGNSADQRDAWWDKFNQVKGLDGEGMPAELKDKGKELDEVTAQPLLNYLVALTWLRSQNGENCIDFSQSVNLNTVYGDMLQGIWDRKYEQQQTKALKDFGYSLYEKLLENIALTAWHGSGRAATLTSVEAGLPREYQDELEKLTGDVRGGIMRLFLGFYIQSRQIDANTELFEFTHKSFGEYLAARKMVATIRKCHLLRTRRRKEGPETGGWTEHECLVEWSRVFGPTRIDADITKFITGELQAKAADGESKVPTDELSGCRETVVELINYVLKTGMPMEARTDLPTFQARNTQAIAAEEALLVFHHQTSAALIAQNVKVEASRVEWPDNTALGDWLTRLAGQREDDGNNATLMSLGYLRANDQLLYFADCFRAEMCSADLANAALEGATLWEASLQDANLHHADLQDANLEGANLEGANLEGANLTRANLARAGLEGASLQDADLSDATLSSSQLESTKGTPRRLPDGSKP